MFRLTTKTLSLVVLTASFAAGLGLISSQDADAEATVTDLCIATGSKMASSESKAGCVYSGPEVPVLATNVCWDGVTARIKGTAACPGKQRTYFAKYGEVVEPQTGEIIAYAPLQSACELVPCAPDQVGAGPAQDGVACCDPETNDCYMPNPNGDCPVGDITWCEEIVANGDGTVTCHE